MYKLFGLLTVLSSLVSTTTPSCKMKISVVLAYCKLCYFQYSLQSVLLFIFVYYKYMNRNKENVSKYDYVYQAKNY